MKIYKLIFLLLTGINIPLISKGSEPINITPELASNINKANYYFIGRFENGIAIVWSQDFKEGRINAKGEEVIPSVYTPRQVWLSENIFRVAKDINENMQLGSIDIDGREIVPLGIYDFASEFHEDLASVVKIDKDKTGHILKFKHGYINRKGELVVPCIYEEASDFKEGLAKVRKDGKFGFINKEGKLVVPCIYSDAGDFHEGLAYVKKHDSYTGKTRYGFINKAGDVVIPFKFDGATDFSEGVAGVQLYSENGKWRFIDTKGEPVNFYMYDSVGEFHEGVAAVEKNGRYFYVNKKKRITEHSYASARSFSNGMGMVGSESELVGGGKKGFITLTGKFIGIFEDAYNFLDNGYAIVKKDGKYGLINKMGEYIIPCKYDDLYAPTQEGLMAAKMNGKWGFIDLEGSEIIPFIYDEADYFSEGVAVVKKDGKCGLVDKSGKDTFDN